MIKHDDKFKCQIVGVVVLDLCRHFRWNMYTNRNKKNVQKVYVFSQVGVFRSYQFEGVKNLENWKFKGTALTQETFQ